MDFEDLNQLGKDRTPFLFFCDFEALHVEVYTLNELSANDIEFKIDENYEVKSYNQAIKKMPISFNEYKKKFDIVQENIKAGNTYLLNLTMPTKIETSLSLKEIFLNANAHYKLRFKDDFVCFSPEKFIQIQDNKIHTFPMKGTIDASIDNAEEKILQDEKEKAEHIMVVDLLRNDLSIIATNIRVQKFRYIQKIKAGKKELLHVSSHISGDLEDNWHEQIGGMLKKILPAGSISGTPKKSTLDIIATIEGYKREFFSGIFGIYDGKSLDSGVMIRFIQKTKDGYIYKSGGGITLDSDVNNEYEELLDKVYLP